MAHKDRENSETPTEQPSTKLGPSVGDVMRYGLEDMRRVWEQVTYGRDPTPSRDGDETLIDPEGKSGSDVFREFFGIEDRAEEQDRERTQDRDRSPEIEP